MGNRNYSDYCDYGAFWNSIMATLLEKIGGTKKNEIRQENRPPNSETQSEKVREEIQPGTTATYCIHPRVVKRVTVIPGAPLLDPQTFFECSSCGWWFTDAELEAEREWQAEQSAP